MTRIVLVAAVSVLLSCGGKQSSTGDDGGFQDVDGGSDAGQQLSGIGPAGGTVTGPGGSQLVVPAGALSSPVALALTATDGAQPPLPLGYAAIGDTLLATPHGTMFAVPAHLSVPFDPAKVPATLTPVLLKTTHGASGPWAEVSGATVVQSHLEGDVSSLSYLVPAVRPVLVNQFSGDWANANPTSITTSNDGSFYVAGQIIGTTLDTSLTVPPGAVTAFIAHFNPNLDLVWVRQFITANRDSASLFLDDNGYSRPSVTVASSGEVCFAFATGYALDPATGGNGALLPSGGGSTRVACVNSSGTMLAGWPTQLTPLAVWMVPVQILATETRLRVLMNAANAPPVPKPASYAAYAELFLGGSSAAAPGLVPLGDSRPNLGNGMCLSAGTLAVSAFVYGSATMLPEDRVVRINGTGQIIAGFPVTSDVGHRGLACSPAGTLYHSNLAWSGVTGTVLSGYPADLSGGVNDTMGDWPAVNAAQFAFIAGQSSNAAARITSVATNGTVRAGYPVDFGPGTIGGMAFDTPGSTLYFTGKLGGAFSVGKLSGL